MNQSTPDSESAQMAAPMLGERPRRLCHIVVLAARAQHAELEVQIEQALDSTCSFSDIYETLTQSYLFLGFPAALEALLCLYNVSKSRPDLKAPQAADYDLENFGARGAQLCRQIYTSAYDKMRSRLAVAAPDLDQWMIVEGYGKTLARPQLEIQIRELLIVAMLCVGGWERQLFSHIRGALNVAVPAETCRAVIQLASAHLTAEKQARYLNILNKLLANAS